MDAIETIGGWIFTTALSLIIWAALPDFAQADVKITVTSEGAKLVANEATIKELLLALRAKFGLTVHSAARLEQRVDGTYAGSLPSIVHQVLKNHDHILKRENGEFVLFVTDQQKSRIQPNSSTAIAQQLASTAPREEKNQESTSGNRPDNQKATSGTNVTNTLGQQNATAPSVSGISEVTSMLQMQARIPTVMPPSSSPVSVTSVPSPSGEGVQTAPSQSAIAETLQRANASLQALKSALTALPR